MNVCVQVEIEYNSSISDGLVASLERIADKHQVKLTVTSSSRFVDSRFVDSLFVDSQFVDSIKIVPAHIGRTAPNAACRKDRCIKRIKEMFVAGSLTLDEYH